MYLFNNIMSFISAITIILILLKMLIISCKYASLHAFIKMYIKNHVC